MERIERMRYVDAIDTLHVLRRAISTLQADAKLALATLPTHDTGPRATAQRVTLAHLHAAGQSITDSIAHMNTVLSPSTDA